MILIKWSCKIGVIVKVLENIKGKFEHVVENTFEAMWMDLDNIMFSEISQTGKTNTEWYHSYVECKK